MDGAITLKLPTMTQEIKPGRNKKINHAIPKRSHHGRTEHRGINSHVHTAAYIIINPVIADLKTVMLMPIPTPLFHSNSQLKEKLIWLSSRMEIQINHSSTLNGETRLMVYHKRAQLANDHMIGQQHLDAPILNEKLPTLHEIDLDHEVGMIDN